MGKNKRVIILVIIALVLATTAVALNTIDSDVPAVGQEGSPTGAVVGIEIQSAPVEDKLAEEGLQQ